MSAKSYTKTHFGGNILIRPLCQNKNFYISSERVLSPFWERRSKYRAGENVENILTQTLYEMVILLFTPSSDTGGFLCVVLGVVSLPTCQFFETHIPRQAGVKIICN